MLKKSTHYTPSIRFAREGAVRQGRYAPPGPPNSLHKLDRMDKPPAHTTRAWTALRVRGLTTLSTDALRLPNSHLKILTTEVRGVRANALALSVAHLRWTTRLGFYGEAM